MPIEIVDTEHRRYWISPDDPVPSVQRVQTVVRARLIDELTQSAPRGPVKLGSEHREMVARAAADGLVGLLGAPLRLFPDLDIQSYHPEMTIRVGGFLPRRLVAEVPQQAAFPSSFEPAPWIEVALHRRPTVLAGRTVAVSGSGTVPVANATVSMLNLWRTPPPANVDPNTVAEPPLIVSLSPGLYFDRGSASTVLNSIDLTPVVADDKELRAKVAAGGTRLRLSDAINLGSGSWVQVDADQAERREALRIDSVEAGSDPSHPATVVLSYPCRLSHEDGTRVARVLPQAPGPPNSLAVDATEHDVCVLATALAGLGAAQTVEISDAVHPFPEYHEVHSFVVTSDGEGFYRLPPLSRVARVRLRADDGMVQTDPLDLSPDYEQPVNRNDLVFD